MDPAVYIKSSRVEFVSFLVFTFLYVQDNAMAGLVLLKEKTLFTIDVNPGGKFISADRSRSLFEVGTCMRVKRWRRRKRKRGEEEEKSECCVFFFQLAAMKTVFVNFSFQRPTKN